MGQALYRKYRSKSLAEIVGQEHITDTLDKAIKSGRINHAYLFTGPKGVGKTSVARILAHQINNLPYDETQQHIDIIEIDAASNNGVEDVRDLREKVYVAPAQANYKVYIIDEVHMLSKQAFNALLKTLEEPPAHVVFILATTEAHKLPATIISRTQRFIFRPIDHTKAVAHLKQIAKKEKIAITDEALELMAQHGDGSFRDSINLLDQAGSHGATVDVNSVQEMIGMPPAQAISELLVTVQTSAAIAPLMQQLSAMYDQGYQANSIAERLSATIREQMIQGTGLSGAAATQLLEKLLEVPVSHNPERYLEIVLLQALPQSVQAAQPGPAPIATAQAPAPASPPLSVPETPETPPLAITITKTAPSKPKPKAAATETAVPEAATPPQPAAGTALLDESNWPQVLGVLKKQYNTLYGIVRMARPDFSNPGKLDLAFAFSFHQKRAHEAKNLQAIVEAITAVTGQTVVISCSHDPELKLAPAKQTKTTALPDVPASPTAEGEPLSAISNIFGGGELLQS